MRRALYTLPWLIVVGIAAQSADLWKDGAWRIAALAPGACATVPQLEVLGPGSIFDTSQAHRLRAIEAALPAALGNTCPNAREIVLVSRRTRRLIKLAPRTSPANVAPAEPAQLPAAAPAAPQRAVPPAGVPTVTTDTAPTAAYATPDAGPTSAAAWAPPPPQSDGATETIVVRAPTGGIRGRGGTETPQPSPPSSTRTASSSDPPAIHAIKVPAGPAAPTLAERFENQCVTQYMASAAETAGGKLSFCRCLTRAATSASVPAKDMEDMAADFTLSGLQAMGKSNRDFAALVGKCYK
jgi:hypothetical protein